MFVQLPEHLGDPTRSELCNGCDEGCWDKLVVLHAHLHGCQGAQLAVVQVAQQTYIQTTHDEKPGTASPHLTSPVVVGALKGGKMRSSLGSVF